MADNVMKLLVAIVQEDDVAPVMEALVEAGLRATRIASHGGFLRVGNATILVGLDDRAAPLARQIFTQHCQRRSAVLPPESQLAPHEWTLPEVVTVEVGGAIVFTVNVARYELF